MGTERKASPALVSTRSVSGAVAVAHSGVSQLCGSDLPPPHMWLWVSKCKAERFSEEAGRGPGLSFAPSEEGWGPRGPQPLLHWCRWKLPGQGEHLKKASEWMSSPFSLVCKGPASGSPGAGCQTAQVHWAARCWASGRPGAERRAARCWVSGCPGAGRRAGHVLGVGQPGAGLQPVVPRPRSTDLVPVAVAPGCGAPLVWGTGRRCCEGTHRLWGRGFSSPAQEVASRFACVISTAAPFLPEEACRLSASSRSHWRKEEDKEGFKKKITKRKTVISNPNLALQCLC